MKTIKPILKNDLCLGCGLCAAIDKNCSMQLNSKGFYRPIGELSSQSSKIIAKICPGINVKNKAKKHSSTWGNVVDVSNAWAKDENIRHLSSSGGVTSALAIYLLESKEVDAVLQVGVKKGEYLYNSICVSRTREEVLNCNSSRYAPVAMFENIINIFNSTSQTFAFIGKPCDIAAMKNFLVEQSEFKERIKYFLSIFCAGMPSYNATKEAIATFNNESEAISLRYRGDGWPGYFTVRYRDGSAEKMTYNDSWGKILGKRLGFRCKICPDGIGLLADIALGDAWNTKDGYPDFTESEGRNFCFVRTERGKELFQKAIESGYIESENVNIEEIKFMQAYQYDRRHYVGWRIAIVQLLTGGLLKFKGLGLIDLCLHSNPKRIVKEIVGTIKRFIKTKE